MFVKTSSANSSNDIDRTTVLAAETPAPERARPTLGLHFDERPWGMQLRFGAATSVGELGIAAEYDVVDWLNLGLGIGSNFSGPMPGAHVRFRPLVSRNESGRVAHAIVGEAATSVGYYDPGVLSWDLDGGGAQPARYVPKVVVWWQVEAGWEAKWASGLTFRVSLGFAQCFTNPTLRYSRDGRQYTTSGSGPPPRAFAQTLAVGYAF